MAPCLTQVHIALGGIGEMVISWVTYADELPAEVIWWEENDAANVSLAFGESNSYTQLLWFDQAPTLSCPKTFPV